MSSDIFITFGTSLRSSPGSYHIQEQLLHLADILVSIHFYQFLLIPVVIKQSNSLIEKDIQSLLDRFPCIIRALVQFTSIYITDTCYFWRMSVYIINVLLCLTDIASRKPFK